MRIILIISIFFSVTVSYSQEQLDKYIKEGLENNLQLKQKEADYQKSLYVLKEAKGYFMPSLTLNARYSVAEGGRTINLPIGDMMNPVYSTLNQITSNMYAMGLADKIFPDTSISNEQINFLRPTEHETKLQLIQPIFNPQIHFNNKIQKELVNAEAANVETYKRQLVADIKSAYYNYLATLEVLELINQTEELLQENIRVNQKLFENDKVTIDAVYRSKAELSKLEESRAEAIKNNQMAKAYFNFLINKPFETEIMSLNHISETNEHQELEQLTQNALEKREELEMMKFYSMATVHKLSYTKSNALPTLTAAVDYGFQGEKYKFTGDYDFVMASLVLRWEIFKGSQNKAKVQQTIIDKEIIDLKLEELAQNISLQVQNSWYEVEAATKKIDAAKDQVKSAESAFKIIEKKYKEDKSSLLEYIDSRTTMTNAKHNLILARLNYHLKYIELERVAGIYNLENE